MEKCFVCYKSVPSVVFYVKWLENKGNPVWVNEHQDTHIMRWAGGADVLCFMVSEGE